MAQGSRRPRRQAGKGAGPRPEPVRFSAERRALGKVQLHFEFRQALLRKVRLAAAAANLNYSDYVRQAVGLPLAKAQRPRISLSFSAADLAALAERYGEPSGDPQVLKRRVMAEIDQCLGGDASRLPAAADDRVDEAPAADGPASGGNTGNGRRPPA